MDFNTLKNLLEDLNKIVKENQDLKKREKQNEKDIVKLFNEKTKLKKQIKENEKIVNIQLANKLIDMWFKENLTYSPDETTSFRDLCSSYTNFIDLTFGKNVRVNIQQLKNVLIKYQNLTELGFKEGINGTITNPKVNFIINKDD